MDGKKADMVFTDPPYGINAEKMTMGAGKKDFHRGAWDSETPDVKWLLEAAKYVCIWGGNYFTDQLPVTNDWLCWHKKNDGRSFSEFELAWTNFGKNTRHISHHWGGEKKQHVTMKPVAVCIWGIKLTEGKIVFDPFLGSGSTLIACEQTDRTCYGLELDPLYVDVICKRWQTLTGQMPILESTGEAHDFMV
jgi:DNA modification methylase